MFLFFYRSYSHADDYMDFGAWLHKDSGDRSDSVLLLWQDPATPMRHRASWIQDGVAASISGEKNL